MSENEAQIQDVFRALVNCLDYLRHERDGHTHSADGDASCVGCCIVAEGEHAIDCFKSSMRTPQ